MDSLLSFFFRNGLCFSFQRKYRNETSVLRTSLFEAYCSVYQCVKSVVLTHAYVVARVVNRTSLTDNDVTGLADLAAEYLYA